jgi:hypothetical protein
VADAGLGAPAFTRFLEGFRALEDLVVSVNPPREIWDAAASHIEAMLHLLDPWGVAKNLSPQLAAWKL